MGENTSQIGEAIHKNFWIKIFLKIKTKQAEEGNGTIKKKQSEKKRNIKGKLQVERERFKKP